jgi:hypothetical protein
MRTRIPGVMLMKWHFKVTLPPPFPQHSYRNQEILQMLAKLFSIETDESASAQTAQYKPRHSHSRTNTRSWLTNLAAKTQLWPGLSVPLGLGPSARLRSPDRYIEQNAEKHRQPQRNTNSGSKRKKERKKLRYVSAIRPHTCVCRLHVSFRGSTRFLERRKHYVF